MTYNITHIIIITIKCAKYKTTYSKYIFPASILYFSNLCLCLNKYTLTVTVFM